MLYWSGLIGIFTFYHSIIIIYYQLQVFIGQFLVAVRSVWLFDDEQNVSSSGTEHAATALWVCNGLVSRGQTQGGRTSPHELVME